jgi:hypothetical protein
MMTPVCDKWVENCAESNSATYSLASADVSQ